MEPHRRPHQQPGPGGGGRYTDDDGSGGGGDGTEQGGFAPSPWQRLSQEQGYNVSSAWVTAAPAPAPPQPRPMVMPPRPPAPVAPYGGPSYAGPPVYGGRGGGGGVQPPYAGEPVAYGTAAPHQQPHYAQAYPPAAPRPPFYVQQQSLQPQLQLQQQQADYGYIALPQPHYPVAPPHYGDGGHYDGGTGYGGPAVHAQQPHSLSSCSTPAESCRSHDRCGSATATTAAGRRRRRLRPTTATSRAATREMSMAVAALTAAPTALTLATTTGAAASTRNSTSSSGTTTAATAAGQAAAAACGFTPVS
jgi:hypothetical protein